ncbi:putative sulfate exporter family transporter [Vibrio sp. CAU 1672]|uniref:YeiH family protein n=1 Tax=Vibrio sp. CAU 1672 TaxID=3032594 RepID=UPI0023D9DA68|nr:putative sulfate exporter family transporter [Vibrio sp. CAU 1672]MDF2153594.1 putative sulfate exporter family transporter [Vibrio sp. CAU 1672]
MSTKYLPFGLALLFCLTPYATSPIALIIGFLLTSLGLVPTAWSLTSITKKLLSYSIIGLGFGIHFQEALAVTADGIGLIVATILGTLVCGYLLAKALRLDRHTAYLISTGTAICGGSAIAAVAPAIRAKDEHIGLALATVFMLNSLALFLFPVIGHALGLDQHTFGTWAAVAIHDTSSVVGAASAYGEEALTTATTLKLARALWIIPVALVSSALFTASNTPDGKRKLAIPYFIFWYCAAIGVSDVLPQWEVVYNMVFMLAKQALVVCLFLIGCSISLARLKSAGAKPLLFGVCLWISVSLTSLTWLLLS